MMMLSSNGTPDAPLRLKHPLMPSIICLQSRLSSLPIAFAPRPAILTRIRHLSTAGAREGTPHPHDFANSQCHPIPLNRLFSTPAMHLVYHRTGSQNTCFRLSSTMALISSQPQPMTTSTPDRGLCIPYIPFLIKQSQSRLHPAQSTTGP